MERRKNNRIKINKNILVETGTAKKIAVAYDVSKTGMHFIFLEKFNRGDNCSVIIDDCPCPGNIMWAIKIDGTEQIFRYGIQFQDELSQEQFQNIIE